MIKTNLPLLFIKNHEIFPFTETKLEFSDINFKQTISLAESCFDNCLFIIHQKQTDNLEAKNNINIGILYLSIIISIISSFKICHTIS